MMATNSRNSETFPPGGWLTKGVASTRLEISESRLSALAVEGKIKTLPARSPESNQPIKLYHEGDVERLVFLRDHPEEKPKLPAKVDKLRGLMPLSQMETLASLALEEQRKERQLPLKPWLTIFEAADWSGLPASAIKALILSGQLPGIDCGPRPGGRWRVKRVDLEKLEGHR